MEAEACASAADELVGAVRSDGLGVAGLEATRRALSIGQVDRLVLVVDGSLDVDQRNELIRLAATSGADVETVAEHAALSKLDGVGALLRYRLD